MKIIRWMVAMVIASGLLVSSAWAAEVEDAILKLQHEWAQANYKTPENQKEASFKALVDKAAALSAKFPNRAEPKIWEAIIRAGYAGAMGGVSSMFNAMPQMEQGRDLLLAAEQIDANALHGSVYTTLGSFYYMVPGGFVGFGDDDKAEAYLKKAIAIAPDDMDANYYIGDFLLDQKRYKEAIPYFQKVIALPPVANRPVYSAGRKAEAKAKLKALEKRVGHKIEMPTPASARVATHVEKAPVQAPQPLSAPVAQASESKVVEPDSAVMPVAKPAVAEAVSEQAMAKAEAVMAAAPAAASVTPKPVTLTIAVNIGNIRNQPGPHGAIVAKLKRGSVVTRLGRQGAWNKVKLANGRVAWGHDSIFR